MKHTILVRFWYISVKVFKNAQNSGNCQLQFVKPQLETVYDWHAWREEKKRLRQGGKQTSRKEKKGRAGKNIWM